MSDVAIRAEGLGKRFRIGERREAYKTMRGALTDAASLPLRALRSRFAGASRRAGESPASIWALKDVSFEIKRGEVLGIIGHNGAGKSTLLKILSRITEPSAGYADIFGRVGSLLEVGAAFHPELTGRENIYLQGAILGMGRAELARKFDEIVAFAEVEQFLDTPVKHFSSGMYLRLAFAVAAHLEPEILLVDEVLAVGDAAFQKKCLGRMEDVAREGRTVLFVSHNMAAIRMLCQKGILLERGRVGEIGDIDRILVAYYKSIGALTDDAADPSEPADDHFVFGPIGLAGRAGNTIDQAESFRLGTRLRVDEGVSGFTLYLFLEDMLGRRVARLRADSTELGPEAARPGRHEVSVSLPPLWLNPGLYSAHFMVVFRGRYAAGHHLSNRFPLDVIGHSSDEPAILHPCATWSVRLPERAPAEALR